MSNKKYFYYFYGNNALKKCNMSSSVKQQTEYSFFYDSAILTNGNADSISQIKKDCFPQSSFSVNRLPFTEGQRVSDHPASHSISAASA